LFLVKFRGGMVLKKTLEEEKRRDKDRGLLLISFKGASSESIGRGHPKNQLLKDIFRMYCYC